VERKRAGLHVQQRTKWNRLQPVRSLNRGYPDRANQLDGALHRQRLTDLAVSGINGNAPLRMKHATQNAFIPYTVAAAFVSQGGGNQRWAVTATVLGQDYQNALGAS
jgi:hypothetical protein